MWRTRLLSERSSIIAYMPIAMDHKSKDALESWFNVQELGSRAK